MRAHPRVCGENDPDHHVITVYSGSSPRMRGKHADKTIYDLQDRLIPAYAGKTPFQIGPIDAEKAHPRVCGENQLRKAEADLSDGSSPRMRGKR